MKKLPKNKALVFKFFTIYKALDFSYYIVTKKQNIVKETKY